MKAMIFAAGLGTRLKPLTDTVPKALVPLAGKPLLQWQVEMLHEAGINDITVNVHHFPDQIIDTVKQQDGWGTRITISDERDLLLNTGGGFYKAVHNAQCTMHNESILACNVDILSNIDLAPLLQTAELHPDTTYLVVSDRPTQRYLCFEENNQLCGWTNIATGELKGKNGRHLAFSGMSIISPTLWPVIEEVAKDKGHVFSLIDVFLASLPYRQSSPIIAYIPSNYRMMDVGKIDQLAQAEEFAQSL